MRSCMHAAAYHQHAFSEFTARYSTTVHHMVTRPLMVPYIHPQLYSFKLDVQDYIYIYIFYPSAWVDQRNCQGVYGS